MKKLLFSVMLVLVLLVVAPASIAAAPEKAVKAKTVDLELFVVAIGRDTTEVYDPVTQTLSITGSVTYTGQVTSVNVEGKDNGKLTESLMDAKVLAIEQVEYVVHPLTGEIFIGKGNGSLRLIDRKDLKDIKDLKNMNDLKALKDMKELKKMKDLLDRKNIFNYMAINFQADIWGNIFTGPAGDIGIWEVARTFGGYSPLKRAEGDWTALVTMVDIDGNGTLDTFAGTVSCMGTY